MDAPFTLLFLFVLYLLHPMLGLVASLGAAAILATVGLARLVEARRERRTSEGIIERLAWPAIAARSGRLVWATVWRHSSPPVASAVLAPG
jgi:ABC-type protease/lipase transport system fused ATPase/permease subunit